MKREQLLQVVKMLSKQFPKKHTLPACECLHISKYNISLTDLTVERNYAVPQDVKLLEDGTDDVLVPLSVMKNILSTKYYENITFSDTEDKVVIYTSGEMVTQFDKIAADEFPLLYAFKEEYHTRLNPHIISVVEDMLFAVNQKDLTCPKFHNVILDGRYIFTTDAQRVPLWKLSSTDFADYASSSYPIPKENIFFPISLIQALPSGIDKPFTLRISAREDDKRIIQVCFDNYTFTQNSMQYDQIRIESVIPKTFDISMVLYSPTLLDNLKMAIIAKKNLVKIKWDENDPDFLYLSAHEDEDDHFGILFKSKLIRQPKGIERMELWYNTTYLRQMLIYEKTKYVEVKLEEGYGKLCFKHGFMMNRLVATESRFVQRVVEFKKRKEETIETVPQAQVTESTDEQKRSEAEPRRDPEGERPESSGVEPNREFDQQGGGDRESCSCQDRGAEPITPERSFSCCNASVHDAEGTGRAPRYDSFENTEDENQSDRASDGGAPSVHDEDGSAAEGSEENIQHP